MDLLEVNAPPSSAARKARSGARVAGRLRYGIGALAVVAIAAQAPAQTAPDPELRPAKDVLAALEKKEFGKARQLLDEIKDPLHKKALAWHVHQHKDVQARFADYAALLPGLKSWPNYAKLVERAEDSIGASEDPERVVAWFKHNVPRSADGWIAYVAALVKLARDAEADPLIKQVWHLVPMKSEQESFFQRQYHRTIAPDDDRARLALLLRAGKKDEAQRLLNRAALPTDERDAAEVRLKMQAGNGSVDDIGAALAKLPETLRHGADLRFDELRWHRRAQRHEAAGLVLEKAPADAAHAARWANEANRVVRELLAGGKPEEAYRAASGHRQPPGENFAAMEFLAGWVALGKLKRAAEAGAHFRKIHDQSGAAISQARGAYWAGRAAAVANDAAAAERWYIVAAGYPHTFYGQLAAAALGRERLVLPADLEVTGTARRSFAALELPRAARLFAALGEPEAAHALLVHLAMDAAEPQAYALIADFASSKDLDRREAAVRAVRRGARSSVPLFELGFPVIDLPPANRIESAYVLALMRQESEFYALAVSPAGARGLMQLMPATAQQMASAAKLPYNRDRLTTDPDYNLRLGTLFLQRLVDRYDGSYALTAAAYNAGPGRVGQWLERYGDPRKGGPELLDWIETIPFDETRNYVQRVLENLAIYRHRAGLKSLSPQPGQIWRAVPADALRLPERPPPLP